MEQKSDKPSFWKLAMVRVMQSLRLVPSDAALRQQESDAQRQEFQDYAAKREAEKQAAAARREAAIQASKVKLSQEIADMDQPIGQPDIGPENIVFTFPGVGDDPKTNLRQIISAHHGDVSPHHIQQLTEKAICTNNALDTSDIDAVNDQARALKVQAEPPKNDVFRDKKKPFYQKEGQGGGFIFPSRKPPSK